MTKGVLTYGINLKNSGNLDTFVKICVDNNNKIPKIITSVPTIFVKSRGVISGPATQGI